MLPSITRPADTAAASSNRQCTLKFALAASRPGALCEQLGKQLYSLRDQLQAVRTISGGAVQQVQGRPLHGMQNGVQVSRSVYPGLPAAMQAMQHAH